ncbi:unnamed protein product [Symbiodinium natans]|uniref:Apple domain-containing protein n=1 Tax=Symbiodinium natans TaxID=878477 RepID=A0A812JN84_9DINO|nr:unnamed protein product [Symbiodinium natans]
MAAARQLVAAPLLRCSRHVLGGLRAAALPVWRRPSPCATSPVGVSLGRVRHASDSKKAPETSGQGEDAGKAAGSGAVQDEAAAADLKGADAEQSAGIKEDVPADSKATEQSAGTKENAAGLSDAPAEDATEQSAGAKEDVAAADAKAAQSPAASDDEAETFRSMPVVTDEHRLQYEISCDAKEGAACVDLGSVFVAVEWNQQCKDWPWEWGAFRYNSCKCVASEPPPSTESPTVGEMTCLSGESCPASYSKECCRSSLTCPSGFVLSEPLDRCHRDADSTAALWLSVTDGVACQTCVRSEPSPTASATSSTTDAQTTEATTSTPSTTQAAAMKEWEMVGTSDSACRGNSTNDSSPSHYSVVPQRITSIEDCKALCVQDASCKGIEYSFGRCEIWTRPEGIFATKQIDGFSCMRYGWATRHLVAMGGGAGRACRGDSPTDNMDSYYTLGKTRPLQDCKARCAAAPLCQGIEFSLGRCEIWLRPIRATASIPGFSCFSYSFQAGALLL